MTENIIKVENLIFEYAKTGEEENITVRAIDDVSFEIEKGSFTAIIGKNGSGKSTLAKNLNGLLIPSSGAVYVAGYDTKDDKHIWDVRQTAGMVFQNPDNQIIASLVEEDVGFGPENLGVPTEDIWKRVNQGLKSVGMLEYSHHSPNRLSGGQQQRVGVARALVVDPEIIFADEPTGNLDSNTSREVMELMQQVVHEKQQTLVMVTHDNHLASFADRIFHIIDGKIVRIDDMTGKSKEEREKEEKKREEEASI